MKNILLFLVSIFVSTTLFSQSDSMEFATALKPIRNPWLGTSFIDNQTTETPLKGNFEFVILHRFTSVSNGVSDLYGLYGASNVKLGFNFGITNAIMLGIGTEKDKRMQEVSCKIRLLQQNRGGSLPISVSFFTNACVSTIEKKYLGYDYTFKDRLSYFSQIIVSRKFNKRLTVQLTESYSHINKLPGTRVQTETDTSIFVEYISPYQHNAIGVSASAHLKLWNDVGLIGEYSQGFYVGSEKNNSQIANQNSIKKDPKPNVALGIEFGTTTHVFQFFASSYRGIIPQNNYVMNQYDFTKKAGIMLGFNIIVKY